jgi:hypothetical protein
MARLNKQATEPVCSIAQNHNVSVTDISGRIHPDPVKQFYQLKLQEKHQDTQQLLQQQQQQPMPQTPPIPHVIPLPQNQLPQPAQPQPVQQHKIVQKHFPPMHQMLQHHFPHQSHFIAQIHLQLVVPIAQPIFLQHGDNVTPQQLPQQPAKQQSVPN